MSIVVYGSKHIFVINYRVTGLSGLKTIKLRHIMNYTNYYIIDSTSFVSDFPLHVLVTMQFMHIDTLDGNTKSRTNII